MNDRDKNLSAPKDNNHTVAPWLIMAVLFVLVLTSVISAFRAENPALSPNGSESSLAENLKKVNSEPDGAPAAAPDQSQNPAQAAPPPPAFIGKIQAKVDLNLHSEPDRASSVVGSANEGAVLSVKAKADGWYQVVTPENGDAYITGSTKYINILEMQQ